MLIELKKGEPEFEGVFFCSKALAKEGKISTPITNLEVKDNWMAATDGRRLHVYFLRTRWSDGLYRPLKITRTHIILHKEEENGKFPDWLGVFPEHRNYKDVRVSPDANMLMASLIRNVDSENITFRFSYLEDALEPYKGGFRTAYIYTSKPGLPVLLEGPERLAMIMPMKG